MSVEFLQPLVPVAASAAPLFEPPVSGPSATSGPFMDLVSQGLQSVNRQLVDTQTDLRDLAFGDATSLHHLMIRLEESRISMQLMLQVRNRLLESYQELMRMQV